jgi:formate hydrogenlyase subunit 3/multisubunit Na+/H+ antiporter MnhD subunit
MKGSYWTAGLVLLFLVLVFAGMMFHFSQMLFGRKPEETPVDEEPRSIRWALLILLAITLITSIAVPLAAGRGIFGKLLWIY